MFIVSMLLILLKISNKLFKYGININNFNDKNGNRTILYFDVSCDHKYW
jgi:hypothetical protein